MNGCDLTFSLSLSQFSSDSSIGASFFLLASRRCWLVSIELGIKTRFFCLSVVTTIIVLSVLLVCSYLLGSFILRWFDGLVVQAGGLQDGGI